MGKMNAKEYEYKMATLKGKYNADVRALNKEFSAHLNPCKIGDIISDDQVTIIVEKIMPTISMMTGLPSNEYYGPMITKAGKLSKKGISSIHLSNLTSILPQSTLKN